MEIAAQSPKTMSFDLKVPGNKTPLQLWSPDRDAFPEGPGAGLLPLARQVWRPQAAMVSPPCSLALFCLQTSASDSTDDTHPRSRRLSASPSGLFPGLLQQARPFPNLSPTSFC